MFFFLIRSRVKGFLFPLFLVSHFLKGFIEDDLVRGVFRGNLYDVMEVKVKSFKQL